MPIFTMARSAAGLVIFGVLFVAVFAKRDLRLNVNFPIPTKHCVANRFALLTILFFIFFLSCGSSDSIDIISNDLENAIGKKEISRNNFLCQIIKIFCTKFGTVFARAIVMPNKKQNTLPKWQTRNLTFAGHIYGQRIPKKAKVPPVWLIEDFYPCG